MEKTEHVKLRRESCADCYFMERAMTPAGDFISICRKKGPHIIGGWTITTNGPVPLQTTVWCVVNPQIDWCDDFKPSSANS